MCVIQNPQILHSMSREERDCNPEWQEAQGHGCLLLGEAWAEESRDREVFSILMCGLR